MHTCCVPLLLYTDVAVGANACAVRVRTSSSALTEDRRVHQVLYIASHQAARCTQNRFLGIRTFRGVVLKNSAEDVGYGRVGTPVFTKGLEPLARVNL